VWSRLIRFRVAIPVAVCLFHLAVLVVVGRQHPFGNYATETDFYHLFAPDASRILAGEMPQNTYQGPGYPLTIALLSKWLGLELFVVGKWLSVTCAVLCGWLIFLLFRNLFGAAIGIGAQLLFLVSGEFPQFSINATTDVFFLLLALLTLVVLLGQGLTIRKRTAVAAVISGCAYLTRYNGIFLPVVCLVGIVLLNHFEQSWRERWRLVALFGVLFLLLISPWLYLNGRRHGSPLYNTNYLNMATQFYPELVAGKTNQDGTRLLETRFRSFGDVIGYNPVQILRRYPLTLWQSLRYSLTEGLVNPTVGVMGLVGMLLAFWRRRTRSLMVLLVAAILYLLLMGLNHWETRYYLFWGVILAGFAVFAIGSIWESIVRRLELVVRWWGLLPVGLFLLLWTLSFAQSRADLRRFLAAQPWEVAAARDFLRGQYGEETSRLRIVARKPHLPYLVGAGWVFFPPVRTIDEFKSWVTANRVDFIVIGKRELKERRELAPLAKASGAPDWLQPVWRYEETGLILYRVTSF
jgi:MFS family permease